MSERSRLARLLLTVLACAALLALACDSPPAPADEKGAPTTAPEAAASATSAEPKGNSPAEVGEGALFTSAAEALEALAGGSAEPFDAYVFYLHGRIIEDAGRRPEHPDYGVYEYDEVLRALAVPGVAVISEARASGTDPQTYASNITRQVGELLAAGVAPEKITVIGFSKGGSIALYVSHQLQHEDVGFVVLAACGPWLDSAQLQLYGRMLSVYETSDQIGSCKPWVEASMSHLFFHEVEVSIGGGHGAFYRPDPSWLDPVLLWTGAPSIRQGLVQPKRLEEPASAPDDAG